MHELSEGARRILDALTVLFAAAAGALTLDRVAAIVTIAAGLMSCACGLLRFHEWRERKRFTRRS
jgi:hypothetical protein